MGCSEKSFITSIFFLFSTLSRECFRTGLFTFSDDLSPELTGSFSSTLYSSNLLRASCFNFAFVCILSLSIFLTPDDFLLFEESVVLLSFLPFSSFIAWTCFSFCSFCVLIISTSMFEDVAIACWLLSDKGSENPESSDGADCSFGIDFLVRSSLLFRLMLRKNRHNQTRVYFN